MRRWLRRLIVTGLALLLVTVTAVIAATATMTHRHGEGHSLDAPVDAAIVLGAGLDPDMVLPYSSRRRAAAGAALLRAGLAHRLIMSGAGFGGDISTAELMRDYAVSLGAPAGAVLVESESATTFENIRFSFALARQAGFDRLALVTDDFHLLRAAGLACYFGDCDIGLVSVPAIRTEDWHEAGRNIVRESLAWWYNLGKMALWSTLARLRVPESRRERLVE